MMTGKRSSLIKYSSSAIVPSSLAKTYPPISLIASIIFSCSVPTPTTYWPSDLVTPARAANWSSVKVLPKCDRSILSAAGPHRPVVWRNFSTAIFWLSVFIFSSDDIIFVDYLLKRQTMPGIINVAQINRPPLSPRFPFVYPSILVGHIVALACLHQATLPLFVSTPVRHLFRLTT